MNAMTPMVLFIKSSHDLRTPTALAELEHESEELDDALASVTKDTDALLLELKGSYSNQHPQGSA